MPTRGAPGHDWVSRFLFPIFMLFLSMCSTGLVFYFSSMRAEIAELRGKIEANGTSIVRLQGADEAQRQTAADMNERLRRLEDRRGR